MISVDVEHVWGCRKFVMFGGSWGCYVDSFAFRWPRYEMMTGKILFPTLPDKDTPVPRVSWPALNSALQTAYYELMSTPSRVTALTVVGALNNLSMLLPRFHSSISFSMSSVSFSMSSISCSMSSISFSMSSSHFA